MSDDQRQGEKASAEDGEEEQGQVVFYKTRTEGERSGASTRAPLTPDNDRIASLTNKMRTATYSKTTNNEKSVLKSKTNSQPAQSYIGSEASCPASGLLPVAPKPETSHSNSGRRMNNLVFQAPNCLNKAHIPGKRGRQDGTPEPEAGDDVTSKPPLQKKTTTSTEAAPVQKAFPPDIYLT